MTQPPTGMPGWPQLNNPQQPAQGGGQQQPQGMGGAPLQQTPGMAAQVLFLFPMNATGGGGGRHCGQGHHTPEPSTTIEELDVTP